MSFCFCDSFFLYIALGIPINSFMWKHSECVFITFTESIDLFSGKCLVTEVACMCIISKIKQSVGGDLCLLFLLSQAWNIKYF